MEIKQVREVLAVAGLNEPTLSALVPDESNYRVLLLQPSGRIEASREGVRNRDSDLATRQFGAFLASALETQADLVITPEYSMPWETLVGEIRAGRVPAIGKLWVLGCESIKFSELENLRHELASNATILYEQLTLTPDPERFTDPLAYVFQTAQTNGDGPLRTVVLVQFKTHPMGDDDHFETDGLQRGTQVYQFGGTGNQLRLVSLICSDAFALQDRHARAIYDRALIVHIQLNEEPRQERYRRYRGKLLDLETHATEILCLNWAKGVWECCGDQTTPWDHLPGSAWYLKPDKFDDRDETLCRNHQRGLYYTWLHPLRSHALFFNFDQAVYQLIATKVAHIGVPAVNSRSRGPRLIKTSLWNGTDGVWEEQATREDGFCTIVNESGGAGDDLLRLAGANPLAAERVLALCAGRIEACVDWHRVRHLDSCVIDESEVICRLTFCQDTNTRAHEFRVARLRRCGHLWNILNGAGPLPRALADLRDGFHLEWSQDFPHQNVISADGRRATVIYMGEEAGTSMIEATKKKVSENLRRTIKDRDERRSARERLAVWFRDRNGQIALYGPNDRVRIDETDETSEFDVGREK
jgi:hypothetical protein